MRLKKAIGMMAATLVLSATSIIAGAQSASAASCYGDYCSNRDPQDTGCSAKAWTQTSIDVYGKTNDFQRTARYLGRLEMRASAICGTQWGRFLPLGEGVPYRIRAEQPETGYVTNWERAAAWQTAWTNQIYSPVKCVRIHLDFTNWENTIDDKYTVCL